MIDEAEEVDAYEAEREDIGDEEPEDGISLCSSSSISSDGDDDDYDDEQPVTKKQRRTSRRN